MAYTLPTGIWPVLAVLLLIVLAAGIAGLAVRGQRVREQHEASERGMLTMLTCHLCGGALEPCSLVTYRSRIVLRRGGLAEAIGAVRCRDCGHIDLFS